MEKGGDGYQYRGKSLDEINVNVDALISDDEQHVSDDTDNTENESDLECENVKSLPKVMSKVLKKTEPYNMEKPSTEDITRKKLPIRKKKSIVVPWSEKDKLLATNFFKEQINLGKAPKKYECENFIRTHKIEKPWRKIKDFVHNAAAKKKIK